MSSFSFLKPPCGRGKDVNLFQKGHIIGINSSKENIQEDHETTQTGLRTVQCIIKTWKDSGEPLSLRKKCGQKKILNDRRSLKRLVKSNHKKTPVELTAVFKSERAFPQTHNVKGTPGIGTKHLWSLKKTLSQ